MDKQCPKAGSVGEEGKGWSMEVLPHQVYLADPFHQASWATPDAAAGTMGTAALTVRAMSERTPPTIRLDIAGAADSVLANSRDRMLVITPVLFQLQRRSCTVILADPAVHLLAFVTLGSKIS